MLLYIMNVNWNWIKQRPQYMAESLSARYDVIVVQRRAFRRRGLKDNPVNGINLVDLPSLPRFGGRFAATEALNSRMNTAAVRRMIEKLQPEIVWLTDPLQVEFLPKSYEGKVVYDCMDSHADFKTGRLTERIIECEGALLQRADLIVVSAQRLADNIARRYGSSSSDKMILVRNGFDGSIVDIENQPVRHDDGVFRICYFGTVGAWFDFGVIKESLERFDDVAYKIIGPISPGVTRYDHPRIEYVGPVAHAKLGEYTRDCDCFVMPFRLEELVLAVDPVKMYEYINFNKNIICVEYPEVERFRDFAEFYNGNEAFCSAITRLRSASKVKYSSEKRLSLLSESSWAKRAEQVFDALPAFEDPKA